MYVATKPLVTLLTDASTRRHIFPSSPTAGHFATTRNGRARARAATMAINWVDLWRMKRTEHDDAVLLWILYVANHVFFLFPFVLSLQLIFLHHACCCFSPSALLLPKSVSWKALKKTLRIQAGQLPDDMFPCQYHKKAIM